MSEEDVTVSATSAEAPSLVWLDPASLVAHPCNPRSEIGDVAELASSIELAGVIEPLIVTPLPDGTMRILAGHRRARAAIAAGVERVPCLVRADLVDAEGEQLATALCENTARTNLSGLDEARAYAQLSAFPGWNPGRIAQVTGRDEASVRRCIEATTLAPELQPAAISGQLSLEDAARVASFAGDPDTYASLLQLTSNGGLRHALVRAERRRDVARRIAEVREDLEANGVHIIERPRHRDAACKLDSLTGDGGDELDANEHAMSCEGHAVFIDDYDGEAVAVCMDPVRFGHCTPPWYRHESEEQAAARIAAEEQAKARRVALEEAASLRQAFVRGLIGAKGKPPAGTLRLAVEMLVEGAIGLPAPEDLAFYLGYDDPGDIETADALAATVRKASERRLPALALAVVAPGAEDNLAAGYSTAGGSWGYSPALSLRWLGFLAGAGHEPTEAEAQLMDETRIELDRAGDGNGEEAAER